MSLITVERIKLFSTRSPYWCLALIVAIGLGLATLFGLVQGGTHASTFMSQQGLQFGLYIFMVLSALAVTTEYRFGTIRTTFLAAPRRELVLLAKTGLLAGVGAIVAAITGFASFYLTGALTKNPETPLVLGQGDGWRLVAGYIPMFAIGAVIAVAVGTLVRQSAGAITILLLWPLLVENLIGLIPTVGKIQPWLPFNAGARFVSPVDDIRDTVTGASHPSPLGGLLIFLATAVVLWIIALVVLKRRDA